MRVLRRPRLQPKDKATKCTLADLNGHRNGQHQVVVFHLTPVVQLLLGSASHFYLERGQHAHQRRRLGQHDLNPQPARLQ